MYRELDPWPWEPPEPSPDRYPNWRPGPHDDKVEIDAHHAEGVRMVFYRKGLLIDVQTYPATMTLAECHDVTEAFFAACWAA